MCERHSFLMDKDGKVYDGMGLTHSHTEIATRNGFESARHDDLNAYEWQPPEGWQGKREQVWDGLNVDRQNFEPKASHDKALERYIVKRFPDMAAWNAPESPDPSLHGKTVTLSGVEYLILIHGRHDVSAGMVRAYGSASVEASGSASVEAYGSASVEAYGSASVVASGSASVALTRWSGDASVQVFDDAVIIDRLTPETIVYTAKPVTLVVADALRQEDQGRVK